MKLSLRRLIDHINEPFDSIESRLTRFNYDSINLRQLDVVKRDTLPIRWLNDSTLMIDTMALEKEPFIIKKTVREMEAMFDSLLRDQDTITERMIDSAFLESMEILMHQFVNNRIIPPIISPGDHKSARFLPDSDKIIITDRQKIIIADKGSPFYIVPSEKMTDSLRIAVKTILSYTAQRDSILLSLNDVEGQKTSFWLTAEKDDLYRYWVKNHENDSVTVWIGNPSKHDVTLILEEDINIERIMKETADDLVIINIQPEKSLAEVEPLKEIPVYWNYGFSSSIALNQTHLSNWSKGGESSLQNLFDIKGTAEYTNTEANTKWINSGRFKYGAIITEEHGLRTNTDMFELNSQLNKVIMEKIDYSAIFYTKNQIAKGYNYPNDSVVVSKFLNPSTFTVGLGLEYKPFKNTAFNFSMLSYKNTFVLDTANIDQTSHGIDGDKRSKQEIGGQLLVKNKINLLGDLNISNSLRLFSNYLEEPENIDVDLEINIDKRITWYFSILVNLHLIYDHDVRFAVLDENDEPILLPDGSEKKVPKVQFRELVGLAFSVIF